MVLACTACRTVVSSFNAIHTTCVRISHRLDVSLHHVTQRNLLEAGEEGVVRHRLDEDGGRDDVDADAPGAAAGLQRAYDTVPLACAGTSYRSMAADMTNDSIAPLTMDATHPATMGSRASRPDMSVKEPPSFKNEVPCCTTCAMRITRHAHKRMPAGANLYLPHEFVHQARLKIGSGQLWGWGHGHGTSYTLLCMGMRTFARGLNGTLPAQKHTLCKS